MPSFLSFCTIFLVLINLIEAEWILEPSSLPVIHSDALQKDPIQLQQLQISGLNGTLHRDTFFTLQNVTELKIIANLISDVEAGALCPSPSLKILELDLALNKNPPTLTKSMFDNCKLEKLVLKCNSYNPSKIDRNALENLKLKTLGIAYLNLSHLDEDFLFLDKTQMTSLVLFDVHITTIHENAFLNFSNLEVLEIVHNDFETIPVGAFKDLTKLKRLSLEVNSLSNLTWNEFEGLCNLEELDLSSNLIESFDAEKIARNMPKLKKLNIYLNSIQCDDEEIFVNQLKGKLKGIEIISKVDLSCD